MSSPRPASSPARGVSIALSAKGYYPATRHQTPRFGPGKVGSVDVLHCYYAHGEENENFQRRTYWLLEEGFMNIVLVHLEIKGAKQSFNRANSAKRLVAGDFILFLSAAHAASTNSRCTIFYNPRASPSELVISLPKYVKGVYPTRIFRGCISGCFVRVRQKTEESSVMREFLVAVLGKMGSRICTSYGLKVYYILVFHMMSNNDLDATADKFAIIIFIYS